MNNCDQLKIWQLETKIKRLEGNDLEQIMIDFNNRIDNIVKKASCDLDELKDKVKARQHSISKADFTSKLELLHRELSMLNEKSHPHVHDGQWINNPMLAAGQAAHSAYCIGIGTLGESNALV